MSTIPTSLPQSGFLTPPQVGLAYSVPKPTATQGAGFTVGIISLGGGFHQSDLARSFADLVAAGLLPAGSVAPTVNTILIDGATGTYGVDHSSDFENTADIYCASTMAPGASINIYIGVGRTSLNNCIARAVTDHVDVITISYGYDDSLHGDFCASSLAAAAVAKIPVLACTGDYGSAAYSTDLNEYPQYPASSPLVIAVGGTNLTLDTNNQRLTETVESNDPEFSSDPGWSGGGGISSLFSSVPSWQSGLTYTPYNTSTGAGTPTSLTARGTPDVSLAMNAYVLYKGGALAYFGGTSAATPVMAGIMVRLIEDTGIRQSSADWNTFFYNNYNSGTFYDITSGNNATHIADGYLAVKGWDPVTGLGSPNYAALSLPLFHVNSHSSVGHNDFERIYLALYDLLGPVPTGYGVTPLSQSRFRGSKIDAQDWNYLHDNIQQCYIHQNGSVSNSINTISKGDIVSAEYVNSLKSVVQGLTANPLTVASNQLLTTTANTVYSSDSTSFTYALYYNWATAQEIDYFFNLSGKIQPNFSATGDNADLNYVIDKLNHLYADNGNYKTSFNITLTSNTNSIVVTSSVSGPRYELSFAFTNPSGNQVNGSVTTTYSTGASGGVQAPVPVAQLLNGASLSPLPIPAFQFPVNGSQTQTMTLGNATGADITVSSISLTGYAHGSVNPTSLTVPNGTNRTFDITYTGSASGIYSGNLVLVTTDYGTVTVPTAIDVGINISLTPSASVLNTTINNNVTPVQTGFYTVSAEGTDATTYSITLSGDAGFDALGQGSSSISGGQLNPSGTPFCLNFNPVGQSNGTYSVAATINVGGASITLTWNVTISVSAPRNLGTWISSLGAYNAVLGLSYDIIQGSKCVTVGIGSNPALVDNGQNSPNIIELSGTSGSFASWQEVYRIPLTNGAYTYYPTGLYLVQKSSPWPGEVAGFTMGGSFGSGASQGSICTITDDGNGNLSILLNSLYSPDYNDTTVYQTQIDLQSCFNYYDGVAYRYTQLESGPVNGYQTHCFSGFDSNGVVQTTLVSANFPSSSGDSGGE